MKVLILAGGHGTRISEESHNMPKPMIKIGDKPIIWHIMKTYSHFGFNDFVILLGYKGYIIKEYFNNYYLHQSDVTFDLIENKIDIINNTSEPWKVTLVDTGLNTLTGGRIKRVEKLVNNERFMLTYGDGVANIDINALLSAHESHGKIATITAVQPDGRFGSLEIGANSEISSFTEKPKGDGAWINGGFFVCEPTVFDYIENRDNSVFEKSPLENIAKDGELNSYKHTGFWKPMDTMRDKIMLNNLWNENKATWKLWK